MTPIPFAIGEEFASKWQFLPYIERGITNFARVDVCNVGGLTEAMKVAGWAEAHYIDLMPHNPLGPICVAATAHLATAVTNFSWLEIRESPTEKQGFYDKEIFPVQPELRGDKVFLSDAPGLGIEVDEASLSEPFRYSESPHVHRRTAQSPTGSPPERSRYRTSSKPHTRSKHVTAIDLTGKTGVIFGVANQRSIAWAIAKALADAGADLAFTYLNERLRGPVEKTVSGLGDPLLVECDATSDEQVANVYEAVSARHGSVDIVIHSVAFADRKDLGGDFSASDLQGFRTALEVSAYTLIPIVSKAVPHMAKRAARLWR